MPHSLSHQMAKAGKRGNQVVKPTAVALQEMIELLWLWITGNSAALLQSQALWQKLPFCASVPPCQWTDSLLFAGRKVRSCTHQACSPLIPLQNQVGNTTVIVVNLHQSLIVKIILLGWHNMIKISCVLFYTYLYLLAHLAVCEHRKTVIYLNACPFIL